MSPRAVIPAPLLALCLLLPVLGTAACGGGTADGEGEPPPPRIVAEHPVTSPAARRAGVVQDEAPAAAPEAPPEPGDESPEPEEPPAADAG